MQEGSFGVAERILAMETAREEENKRFNSEREILLALAPDRWKELKDAFTSECDCLSQRSRRLQFECEELNSTSFRINRFYGEVRVPAVDFVFEPRVPRIVFQIHLGKQNRGSLDFCVAGSTVLFANGTSGVILAQFLTNVMFRITR
jgi:hypothetical protein